MSSASTSTCSQPSICRPRISKRRTCWVLDHGLGVGRVDAQEQAALAAGADRHVSVHEEGESAEHALLAQAGFALDDVPDPVGKLLVVRHVGQEDIGASSTTASCRLTFAW